MHLSLSLIFHVSILGETKEATVRGGKLLRISDMHEACMPMLRICNKGPSYAAP